MYPPPVIFFGPNPHFLCAHKKKKIGIDATIRIGLEIQSLPYAEFVMHFHTLYATQNVCKIWHSLRIKIKVSIKIPLCFIVKLVTSKVMMQQG